MSSEKKLALAASLQEALKSVTIVRSESDSLDHGTYRLRVLRSRQVYDPHTGLLTSSYRPRIINSGVREAILNLLKDELSEFIHEGRTYSASYPILGGMASGASVEDILDNLVKAAIVEGPEEAARAFFDSIASGYLAFQDYFLLTGIRVEEEVQVFDGVSLVPLPNSTERLPGYLPPMLWSDDPGQFLSKTLLRMDMTVFPLLQQPDQDHHVATWPERYFTIAISSADVREVQPAQFAQALTFVGQHPVQIARRWTYLSDRHIFNLGLGGGSGYSDSWVDIGSPSTTFSEAQVQEGVVLYHKIAGLLNDVQEHLQVPLDRWVKSKTSRGDVDKMIDLGIAFESFFLRGISQEVTFRFSLRGSLYLEEGMEERTRLKKELEAIYRYRSRAVHEGTLPDNVTVNGENVSIGQFIERAHELFKKSLLKAIENGHLPEWGRIELGGGEEADGHSSEPSESPPVTIAGVEE